MNTKGNVSTDEFRVLLANAIPNFYKTRSEFVRSFNDYYHGITGLRDSILFMQLTKRRTLSSTYKALYYEFFLRNHEYRLF